MLSNGVFLDAGPNVLMKTISEHEEQLVYAIVFDDFREKGTRGRILVLTQERAYILDIHTLKVEDYVVDQVPCELVHPLLLSPVIVHIFGIEKEPIAPEPLLGKVLSHPFLGLG